ncbi:MAG: DEAD/DEAH box helicase, partial [Myxococcales bacterium]|nr:DEAD/DEAH box helicase [Myxococcales bacterium]
ATSRYDALVNELLMGGKRCLVFVRRRVDAAEVADKLQADGFEAVALSGDLPQNERDRCLEGFR